MSIKAIFLIFENNENDRMRNNLAKLDTAKAIAVAAANEACTANKSVPSAMTAKTPHEPKIPWPDCLAASLSIFLRTFRSLLTNRFSTLLSR